MCEELAYGFVCLGLYHVNRSDRAFALVCARVRTHRYVVDASCRTSEEMRERERLADPDRTNMIRKAAEVHRRVRAYARKELLKPGMPLIEICEKLENATRVYLEANKSPTAGTRAGVGV